MLLMVLRKMFSNKWMFISLVVGSILTVAMVSSIPIYTSGVLQRLLTKTLENYQVTEDTYPGLYHVKAKIHSSYEGENRLKAYKHFSSNIKDDLINDIPVPIVDKLENISIDYMVSVPEKIKNEKDKEQTVSIETLSDIEKHAKILHGRLPSNQMVDGVYEVMVTEATLKHMDISLDEVFTVKDSEGREYEEYRFKVVGVFTAEDTNDVYWFINFKKLLDSFIMDYSLFYSDFIEKDSPLISRAQWYYAFDYHKIYTEDMDQICASYDKHSKWYNQYHGLILDMPSIDVITKYSNKEKQLTTTLLVFQVPILILLFFYMFMVSQLIIQNDQNEISILKSRGASNRNIIFIYMMESLILAGISLGVGPPFGLFLCKILGAANGFLEFVNRGTLRLNLSLKAYIYALAAVIISTSTMLIPAIKATRKSIVMYKQSLMLPKSPIWKKYFFDIIFLGISYYGIYRYNSNNIGTVDGSSMNIDPLMFLISTFFILGCGLFLLRIYPFILKIIFKIGHRWWNSVLYASFIQVSRTGGKDKFLMIFLIFTLSIGIFNANAARTINTNIVEQIRYANGADIKIEPYWLARTVSSAVNQLNAPGAGAIMKSLPKIYQEPPFKIYRELEGVESATKVMHRKDGVLTTPSNENISNLEVMGIIPSEFGKTAWFRTDLLPYHWYQYLNLLSEEPRALLLSSSLKEKVELGDEVWFRIGEQKYIKGFVYAFIDYWPAFNPNPVKKGMKTPEFIVTNLNYLHDQLTLDPYDIWVKKDDAASSKDIYDSIEESDLMIENLYDADQEVIKMKNDPMIQSTNGSLTLGFIITMLISTIGFLIYWLLSIKKRILQFGITRAIGLTKRAIIGMLVCEQILISGVAIVMGIFVGNMTSKIFVPFIQSINSVKEAVPPYRVLSNPGDLQKIYIFVSLMLFVGITILTRIVSRIKIDQALKLGED